MNKSQKIFYVFSLLLILIILTSCAGSRELDKLGIVISTGYDIEDGKVILTNEVIKPVATSGTGSKNNVTQEGSVFIQGRGDTIMEAVSNSSLSFNRELYYSQNRLVILGEEFAKRGIGDYLDVFTRNNEERETEYIVIAKENKAYDVMGVNSGLVKTSGIYLYDIIKGINDNSKIRALTLSEFFKYYYNLSTNPVLGVAKVVEHPIINKAEQGSNLLLDVEGGAVFNKDKLLGYYTGDEMSGYNFIVDTLKRATIVFETPSYLTESSNLISKKGKNAALQVTKSKTKKTINLIDGKLHLSINVKLTGELAEESQGLDLVKPGIINEMENACSEKIKSLIMATMDKTQNEFEIDCFSIGELVHRKYPKLWKEISMDWPEIFSELDYSVNVKTHMNNILFTNTPANIKKGK